LWRPDFLASIHARPPDEGRYPTLLRELADSFFALLFPTACSLCDEELTSSGWVGICQACWRELQPWTGSACGRCGIPFPSDLTLQSDRLCAECRRGEYEFDLARSYGIYAGKLRTVILQLKFVRRERLGRHLGELLLSSGLSINEVEREVPRVLVPVPLHRSRQRERGFNQAELLARGLARALKRSAGGGPARRVLRVETHCLRRLRPTVPQTGLRPRARQENVRGVFAVTSPERVRDRVVWLIDDVMTTGATASACASALKGAGARQVVVLTLARATPQFPDIIGDGRSAVAADAEVS